jgi:4-amino-4-deoxy-L-arabinose transferase-like glycosyltransferase
MSLVIPNLRRRDLIALALVVAVVLAIDVPLLPSGVWIGDEAEAQTDPYILAIMHPTGFPFYVLAGWVFSHLLAVGTVAWRFNLFTAVLTALTAAGIVLLARALGSGLLAATGAAFAYAFGTIVWGGAIHTNVQVLSATCSVYALVAAVAFARTGETRALVAACALCGFGAAAHPASIFILPGIAVALLWQCRLTTKRALLAGLIAFALPLLLYAYLPLRSAAVAPPAATAISGQVSLDPQSLDWDPVAPRTEAGFFDKVLGRNEHATSFLLDAMDPHAFPGAAQAWFHIASLQYGVWLLVLAAAGCAALAWSDRRSLGVLAAVALGSIMFAYVYRDDAHLDRYYLLSFAIAAALAAACSRIVLPRLPANTVRLVSALALALIAAYALVHDRPDPQPGPLQNGEALVAAVAHDTPGNAIVIAEWNEACALRYGAFVEHALDRRTIIAANVGAYVGRYPQWVRTRPVVFYLAPGSWQSVAYFGLRIGELPSSLPPYRVFLVLPNRQRDEVHTRG